MRKNWTLALALAAVSTGALLTPPGAMAQDAPYSVNYVSIGGGLSEITERFGDHFFDNSSSGTGGSLGANARFSLVPGLILDLDYARDQASINDLDVTRQQGQVGLGFMGAVGLYSNWYVEGLYAHVQFRRNSNSFCGGECLTEQHDGGGVEGGFVWPVSPQWYFNLGTGYLAFGAHDGYEALSEPFVNASAGFKLTPEISLGVRAEYDAYANRNHSALEEDFASWRAFVSYHF
jgi:hypothetical protein